MATSKEGNTGQGRCHRPAESVGASYPHSPLPPSRERNTIRRKAKEKEGAATLS